MNRCEPGDNQQIIFGNMHRLQNEALLLKCTVLRQMLFSVKSFNGSSDGCKHPKMQDELGFLLSKHLIIQKEFEFFFKKKRGCEFIFLQLSSLIAAVAQDQKYICKKNTYFTLQITLATLFSEHCHFYHSFNIYFSSKSC